MIRSVFLALFIFSPLLAACSHTSYVPDTSAPKAQVAGTGVVIPIPPDRPLIQMKLVSLPTPKDHTLRVRMYVMRTGLDTKQKILLDPRAQILILPDHGVQLKPAKIYANTAAKPSINLNGVDKEGIELVYNLPKGGDEYPYFTFRWAVKYGNGHLEAQNTRFDRETKSSGNPDPLTPGFPRDAAFDAEYGPEWFGPGFGWW